VRCQGPRPDPAPALHLHERTVADQLVLRHRQDDAFDAELRSQILRSSNRLDQGADRVAQLAHTCRERVGLDAALLEDYRRGRTAMAQALESRLGRSVARGHALQGLGAVEQAGKLVAVEAVPQWQLDRKQREQSMINCDCSTASLLAGSMAGMTTSFMALITLAIWIFGSHLHISFLAR